MTKLKKDKSNFLRFKFKTTHEFNDKIFIVNKMTNIEYDLQLLGSCFVLQTTTNS